MNGRPKLSSEEGVVNDRIRVPVDHPLLVAFEGREAMSPFAMLHHHAAFSLPSRWLEAVMDLEDRVFHPILDECLPQAVSV